MGPSRHHHPGPPGTEGQTLQLRGRPRHAPHGRVLRPDGRDGAGHGRPCLAGPSEAHRLAQARRPDLDGRRRDPTRRRARGGPRGALSGRGRRRGVRPQGRLAPGRAAAGLLPHRQGQGGSPLRHRPRRGLRGGLLRALGVRHPGGAQVPPRAAGEPSHHRQARALGDRRQPAGHPGPRRRGDGGAGRSRPRRALGGSADHSARCHQAGAARQGACHRRHADARVHGALPPADACGGDRRRHGHLRGR